MSFKPWCFALFFFWNIAFAQTIAISATGEASSSEAAMQSAFRKSLIQAITDFSGTVPTDNDGILLETDKFISNYEIVGKKFDSATQIWSVTIKSEVEKDQLSARLLQSAYLLTEINNPAILAFYDNKNGTDSDLQKEILFITNKFLTSQTFYTFDLDQLEKLAADDAEMKALLGEKESLFDKMAKKYKADLYILISSENKTTGKTALVKTTVKAFNTTTAKLYSQTTGESDPVYYNGKELNITDLETEQSVNRALADLVIQAHKYWELEKDKGINYKLFLNNLPEGMQKQKELFELFKANRLKFKKISNEEFDFTFKGDSSEIVGLIGDGLERIYGKKLDCTNRGNRIDVFVGK